MAEFEQLIGPLLVREGGYSNRTADRGGATNRGITQKTLDRWNVTSKSQYAGTVRDVRGLTSTVATAIY
ncbi:MAG TPA: glycosyl hydrolase 108 family protein, partial [Candidatus Paceibacterota bacterium]